MSDKGRMFPTYTVECACLKWMHLSSGRYARRVREAKAAGWKYSPKYGWRCPDCVLKLGKDI